MFYGGAHLPNDFFLHLFCTMGTKLKMSEIFLMFRGETKSVAIERVQKQIRKANKNYHKEGRKVLFFTSFKKDIFDQYIALKSRMNREANTPEDFIFHPFLDKSVNPDYESLKNMDRDLGRTLGIKHSFNATQYRKRMQTTFAQEVHDPETMQKIDGHMGHGWKTGLEFYTDINKEECGQVVSNLVTQHMTVCYFRLFLWSRSDLWMKKPDFHRSHLKQRILHHLMLGEVKFVFYTCFHSMWWCKFSWKKKQTNGEDLRIIVFSKLRLSCRRFLKRFIKQNRFLGVRLTIGWWSQEEYLCKFSTLSSANLINRRFLFRKRHVRFRLLQSMKDQRVKKLVLSKKYFNFLYYPPQKKLNWN